MFKSIATYTKFYFIIHQNGIPQTVRRDVYWDSGFKSPKEIKLIEQIEAQLEDGGLPRYTA